MNAREIHFKPAFHRCNDDASKDYGIGDARMRWILRDGLDAISWEVSTGWGMPTEAFHAARPNCRHPMHKNGWPSGRAMGCSVDWHMSEPMPDCEEWRNEHCVVLDGPCYADVGYLLGDDLFDLLRVEGEEAVWSKLHELLTERRVTKASTS